MLGRGLLRGVDIKFLALDLAPNFAKSSWAVSGYQSEAFPSLFPKKIKDNKITYTKAATDKAIESFRARSQYGADTYSK